MTDLATLHRRFLLSTYIADYNRARRDQEIVAAIDAGSSYGQVAKELGMPRGTVQSIVRKYRGERMAG